MISDSTAVICLGRIGELDLLRKVYGRIVIPQSVKDEILVQNKPGFFQISKAVGNWIVVEEPKKKVDYGLCGGENDAINLAAERNDCIILDDSMAVQVARALNLNFVRTTTVIFTAIRNKIITKDKALEILDKLIETGYYIGTKEYSTLLKRLK